MEIRTLQHLAILLQFFSVFLIAPDLIGVGRLENVREQLRNPKLSKTSKIAISDRIVLNFVFAISLGLILAVSLIVGYLVTAQIRGSGFDAFWVILFLLISMIFYLIFAFLLSIVAGLFLRFAQLSVSLLLISPVRRVCLIFGVAFFLLSTIIQLAVI